jgi:hypothetical protein
MKDAEASGIGFKDDLSPQGGLDEFEGGQGQASEPTVLGVADAAIHGIAKGRAEDADRGGVAALDFEMEGWLFHGGYRIMSRTVCPSIYSVK